MLKIDLEVLANSDIKGIADKKNEIIVNSILKKKETKLFLFHIMILKHERYIILYNYYYYLITFINIKRK